jgi:hypothetical protein
LDVQRCRVRIANTFFLIAARVVRQPSVDRRVT